MKCMLCVPHCMWTLEHEFPVRTETPLFGCAILFTIARSHHVWPVDWLYVLSYLIKGNSLLMKVSTCLFHSHILWLMKLLQTMHGLAWLGYDYIPHKKAILQYSILNIGNIRIMFLYRPRMARSEGLRSIYESQMCHTFIIANNNSTLPQRRAIYIT